MVKSVRIRKRAECPKSNASPSASDGRNNSTVLVLSISESANKSNRRSSSRKKHLPRIKSENLGHHWPQAKSR